MSSTRLARTLSANSLALPKSPSLRRQLACRLGTVYSTVCSPPAWLVRMAVYRGPPSPSVSARWAARAASRQHRATSNFCLVRK